MPRRIDPHLEDLIVVDGKMRGYGAQRLAGYLLQKYGYELSMYTVKKVVKRNKVPKKKVRTMGGTMPGKLGDLRSQTSPGLSSLHSLACPG
jgi:hypothetical protein